MALSVSFKEDNEICLSVWRGKENRVVCIEIFTLKRTPQGEEVEDKSVILSLSPDQFIDFKQKINNLD